MAFYSPIVIHLLDLSADVPINALLRESVHTLRLPTPKISFSSSH
jgi:hypothetical protein